MEKLNQIACCSLRTSIDGSIAALESSLKVELKDLNPTAQSYFEARRKQSLSAIGQLKALRAQVHRRAFEAYKEEAAASPPTPLEG